MDKKYLYINNSPPQQDKDNYFQPIKRLGYFILLVLQENYKNKKKETAEKIQKNHYQLTNFTTRQINASITKSLIRFGYCRRLKLETPVLKKEYKVIIITQKGIDYLKQEPKPAELKWIEELRLLKEKLDNDKKNTTKN